MSRNHNYCAVPEVIALQSTEAREFVHLHLTRLAEFIGRKVQESALVLTTVICGNRLPHGNRLPLALIRLGQLSSRHALEDR